MFIKTFEVKNFRGFAEAKFHFHPEMNVITGVNNSGKTTLLEALSLWAEAFAKLAKVAGKNMPDYGYQKGDFIFESNTSALNFSVKEMVSLNVTSLKEVFYKHDYKERIALSAVLAEGNTALTVTFEISSGGRTLHIASINRPHGFYQTLNKLLNPRKALKQPADLINVVFAKPLGYLPLREELVIDAKIDHQINVRDTSAVFRNRLLRLFSASAQGVRNRDNFVRDLEYVLYNSGRSISLEPKVGVKSLHARIDYRFTANDPYYDMSSLGSGTLQIMELLLALYEQKEEEALNLILLDEPDSHIHHDIQRRLMEVLRQRVGNNQIILTTHNESLIRSTAPEHLFHLSDSPTGVYQSVAQEGALAGPKEGLQAGALGNIINALTGGNGYDFVVALESDRIFLVEGTDDAMHFQAILWRNGGARYKYAFWAFDGLSNIFKNIQNFKTVFTHIKNQVSLWEKSVLVFDKDFFDDAQRQALMERLGEGLGIGIYIWSSYNFEATLLKEPAKLALLLKRWLENEHGRSVSAEELEEQITNAINQEIDKKKDKLNNLMEDSKERDLHFSQLSKEPRARFKQLREQKLWESSNANAVNIDPQIEAMGSFRDYYKGSLNLEDFHKIAVKKDTGGIINHALAGYGVTLDISQPASMQALIRHAKTGDTPEEWSVLARLGTP